MTQPPIQASPGSSPSRNGSFRHPKIVVGILSAVGTILAALATIFGLLWHTASTTVNNQTIYNNGLANQNSQLQSQYAQATQSVASLQSHVASVPTPQNSKSPTTTSGEVLHQGPLGVDSTSRHADLDAPASDPQWGRDADPSLSENEMAVDDGTLLRFESGVQEASSLTPYTYATCRSASDLSDRGSSGIKLQPDLSICVETDLGNFSVLNVVVLSSDGTQLAVTTYSS